VNFQIALSLDGIRQTETTLARSLGTISCLYFLALTTPMTEIVGLLRRLRVPTLFLELMILAYRHIFIFLQITNEVTVAQSSRLGYSTTRNSFRSLSALGGNLFLRVLRRSRQLHQALLARGYQDDLRYLEEPHAWSPRNLVGGALLGAAFLSLSIFLPG
jgi:cobalt/nickel transport system permease protein